MNSRRVLRRSSTVRPLNATEQQQLRDAIASHIADIVGTFAGQLSVWDVVNEERANHDVMDNLSEGDAAMVTWFQQAQAADPASARYINDYGILSSGGDVNSWAQQAYLDTIQYLVDSGAPIDGIGFQSHFREAELTGPEQLWQILDRFQQFGLDMQITEFDFETTNEQLQADYTRDFLTAMFAHEGVDDVVFWGFWEDTHWRPDAALFNSDWSIKPNGQAYLELVFGEWWTDEDLQTDAAGQGTVRGFKGDYSVEVSALGLSETVEGTLSDDGLQLIVTLPVLQGDFDGDGDVDVADLLEWQCGNSPDPFSQSDLAVWRTGFGATQVQMGMSVQVPAPSTLSIGLCALANGPAQRSRSFVEAVARSVPRSHRRDLVGTSFPADFGKISEAKTESLATDPVSMVLTLGGSLYENARASQRSARIGTRCLFRLRRS